MNKTNKTKKTKKETKTNLPNNVSEQEFLQVWEKISKKLGYKFKFGYHSHEDMKQQAAIFALEGLKNYDNSRPLENFLWTHVRNRLFNYKRDNYQRPDKPCLTCPLYNSKDKICTEFNDTMDCSLYEGWIKRNDAKKNIMKPVNMEAITHTNNELSCENLFENISNKEILDIIDINISIKNRPIFLKIKGGSKVLKSDMKKLLNEIKKILKNHDIQF